MSASDPGAVSPVPEHLHTVTPRLVASQFAVAMRPPSGLTATPLMVPWVSKTWRTLPDAVSHTTGDPIAPVTRIDPSGPKAEPMLASWPENVRSSRPDEGSERRAWPLELVVARRDPSGL